MFLRLNTGLSWECDAIHVNISPHMLANDTHSLAVQEGVIRSARQMGSYIAMGKLGVQIGLLDPNVIISVQVNNAAEIK